MDADGASDPAGRGARRQGRAAPDLPGRAGGPVRTAGAAGGEASRAENEGADGIPLPRPVQKRHGGAVAGAFRRTAAHRPRTRRGAGFLPYLPAGGTGKRKGVEKKLP